MKVMNQKILFLALLSVSSVFAIDSVSPTEKTPLIFEVEAQNTKSPYTAALIQTLKKWPKPRDFCQAEKDPHKIHTVGIRTPDRDYYVGFKKCMLLDAPVAKAAAVVNDVANYQKLFPGFKAVEKVAQTGEEVVLEWEKEIPFFLAANIKYQIAYLFHPVSEDIQFFRYQFRKGERLKYNDGIEVFEKLPNGKTLFTNYEFYEADYGIGLLGINAVSSETVWKESLDGSYRSILSIRFKSEHPEWSYDKIKAEAEAVLKKIDTSKVKYLNSWKESYLPKIEF